MSTTIKREWCLMMTKKNVCWTFVIKGRGKVWDLWFSKWCCWRLKFSEIWQCVLERVVWRIMVPSSSGLKSPRRLKIDLPWSFKVSYPRWLDSSKVKLSLCLVKTTSWRYVGSGKLGGSLSKNNCRCIVFIGLTMTCFGRAWPSSGHKLGYK